MKPHPLFPPVDEDGDAPEVVSIRVTRARDGGRKPEFASDEFRAEDLTSLAQLHAQFGGGEYELIALDAKHRITRRVHYPLAGPQLPMYDPAAFDDRAPPRPQASAAPGAPVVQSGMGPEMVLALMKMSADQSNAMVTAMAQIFSSRGQDSDRYVTMMAEQSRRSEETMRTFFQTMLASAQSQSQGGVAQILDVLQRGIDLGRETGGGAEEEDGGGLEQGLEAAERIVGVMRQAQQMGPQRPPGAPPPNGQAPRVGPEPGQPVAGEPEDAPL